MMKKTSPRKFPRDIQTLRLDIQMTGNDVLGTFFRAPGVSLWYIRSGLILQSPAAFLPLSRYVN